TILVNAQQGYLDLQGNNNDVNTVKGTATISSLQSDVQDIFSTYTDLTSFQNDLTANCLDASTTLEDFTNGPGGITSCGTVVSSAGDSCYPAGELETGFSITASNSSDVVGIENGEIGNTSDLVGAQSFPEFTIITFSTPVYAVAFDVWENIDPQTDIRIYDASDNLINSYNVTTPINSQTFFGFISDEEVSRVEVEGNNDSGELIGNMYFGADCSTLSIENVLASQVNIFPNPASNMLTLEMPDTLKPIAITAYNLLGIRQSLNFNQNNMADISILSSGTYFIIIETNTGALTKRLIKK
ncbi:MAG: T9SS type A sorting domain-containing protein, partial [Bacteroidota bacterium]